MHTWKRFLLLTLGLVCLIHFKLLSQQSIETMSCDSSSTVILFRTFDIFSFDRSYKLYASDSLLGRIKTRQVIILSTNSKGIAFHATTKAPSLNASKKANYQKFKNISYPINLKSGQIYLVKCGYLAQNLLDLPRQPTIKLLKPTDTRKYLKKWFIRRNIKEYLYRKWLLEKKINK